MVGVSCVELFGLYGDVWGVQAMYVIECIFTKTIIIIFQKKILLPLVKTMYIG